MATQGGAQTATAEATATEDVTEDTTEKDDPNERVEKVETYAEKVSAGVKIAEVSRAIQMCLQYKQTWLLG